MNRFMSMKCQPRNLGESYAYRSEFVIWYTNGRLACGPRVLQIKPGIDERRISRHKRRFTLHPFSNRFPF